MADSKIYRFDEIRRLLKLSKSDAVDEGPYHLRIWNYSGDYGEFVNRHGEVVAQPTGLQLMQLGLTNRM